MHVCHQESVLTFELTQYLTENTTYPLTTEVKILRQDGPGTPQYILKLYRETDEGL